MDYANLKGGNFVEIMNFFHLDGAQMLLPDVRLSGISGWSKLLLGIFNSWLPHIKQTQVPKLVSGVSGARPLVNFGGGFVSLTDSTV